MRNADGYSWDHSNARKEDYYEPIPASDANKIKTQR